MSETKTLKCNCGCGMVTERNQAAGWLILDQVDLLESRPSSTPKLDEVLHFASLKCLERWVCSAKEAIADLEIDKRLFPFRGELRSGKCEGFHI